MQVNGAAAIHVHNCTFAHNQGYWGAVLIDRGSPKFSSVVFKSNGPNGALQILGGTPQFIDCTFEDNSAVSEGWSRGAMYKSASSIHTLSLKNCTFRRNWAGLGAGGAISILGGGMQCDECLFKHNWAGTGGGALYAESETGVRSEIELTNTRFENNSALVSGGAVACVHGSFMCTECVFEHNHAILNGGAIYLQMTDQTSWEIICSWVTTASVTNNTATQAGGAFYFTVQQEDTINCISAAIQPIQLHGQNQAGRYGNTAASSADHLQIISAQGQSKTSRNSTLVFPGHLLDINFSC